MRRPYRVVLFSLIGLAAYLTAESLLPVRFQPSAQASLALIEGYQSVGSPALKAGGVRCKYTPTCSHYAQDAIGHYGTLGGMALTAGRIWRCSPWGVGGYDPAVTVAEICQAQETEAERRKREDETRRAQEEFRKASERLSKPPDQAAVDELFKAMKAAPPPGQDTPEEQKKEEEARKAIQDFTKEAGTGCAIAGIFCIVIPIVGVIVSVIIMVWVYKDAKSRGDQNAVIWLVLIFFLGIIGLVIYLLARPKGNLAPCANCHNKKLDVLSKCPHCGNEAGAAKA